MTLFELHQKGETLAAQTIEADLLALARDWRFASVVALIERTRDQAALSGCSEVIADKAGRLAFLKGQEHGCRLLLAQLARALAEPAEVDHGLENEPEDS